MTTRDSLPSSAALFDQIWRTLADVVGSGATATLLRRAARRAMANGSSMEGLAIEHRGLEYRYTLPESWQEPSSASLASLRALTRELRPLLVELTGPVLIARLKTHPELRGAELFADEEVK